MLLTADKIVYGGLARSGLGIEIADDGRILSVGQLAAMGRPDRDLKGRVLMPGFVNAHSHAFHRLLRGRTQVAGPAGDSFWTWRETMYWVASRLDAHAVYVASRQAFMEMLLAGVTTVGEFHYLLNEPDGTPYEGIHELADAVIEAARQVGIRLSLIRVVYLAGGFGRAPSEHQQRFCDPSVDVACDRFDGLVHRILSFGDHRISWAIAAHSVRAVPLESLVALKLRLSHMPFHIHISEQQREVEDCVEFYGASPVALLASHKLLDSCTTLVHATHLRPGEVEAIAASGALVCVCPSTEADLADGLIPASDLHQRGVPMCLGTDGQTLSSVLSEARRLEMHERLRCRQRNRLACGEGDSVAARLLHMATQVGATSLGVETGALEYGKWADFVTYDIDDPALSGSDGSSLLSAILFSVDGRAVRDVIVGGRFVVEDGELPGARAYSKQYARLCADLFDSR